jgi:DNA-binding beta-propeller fold protein YncE
MAPSIPRAMQRLAFAALAAAVFLVAAPARAASFALFESGQVRPLALSPDGQRLFAVNTPDNRLEIFRVTAGGLAHEKSVTVGLEPVAVAARSNDEVWVVNHLSDSVSVVDVSDPAKACLVRTLLVGDEPRDIVFAGPGRRRAFITTAHRGQNLPFDPQLTTPGVGRADVWVFDAAAPGDASLGGKPLAVLTLFTDTPRALAVSPDGGRVYAAGFHTGNQTTSVHKFLVRDHGGLPPPTTDHLGNPQPPTALIVKFNGTNWVDTIGRPWDEHLRFSLPDKDVFVIDAMANPPAQLAGPAGFYAGVGTIIYNLAVNPKSGKVYASNTEANNLNRFEGPGVFAGHTIRGHLHESRITVLGPGAGVAPRHLNKHIDYDACCAPVPNAENAKSLALPVGMAVTGDGKTLYVAALGSSKIGVYSTSQLENDTFVPSTASQIVLDKNGEPVGPTGLVLDEPRGRLYVLTRFDNAIAVVKTSTRQVLARAPLYNPEPASVTRGRKFLYDARFTSANGESPCASCHVFGDLDSLAWDLGNPDGTTVFNPGPVGVDFDFGIQTIFNFPALKGPMTTQSLRGMANHGAMHWRGDRTGNLDAPSAQPDGGAFDERAAFEKFQRGFVDLLGRSAPLPDDAMRAFADFALQIMYPPNPIRHLDNSLTPDQQAGREHFNLPNNDVDVSCGSTCHVVDPGQNAEFGVPFPGVFGSSLFYVRGEQPQEFKVPHLRNAYQKVGMFGLADVPAEYVSGDNDFMGDQVRGFGFTHDGSVDTILRQDRVFGFSNLFAENGFESDAQRRQDEAYILAFESNLAPIVGQQVTLTPKNGAQALPRLKLLAERADERECDLVAKAAVGGEEFGFFYAGGGQFLASRKALGQVPKPALVALALAFHLPVTFTCVPPGAGRRIGIDRDEDGVRDGDEGDH